MALSTSSYYLAPNILIRARQLLLTMLRVFCLLNSSDQKLTFDHLVEIRKQSALEEAQEPEPEPEPKERNERVVKLTEGLELTEGGIRVSEDVDWD